MTDPTEAEVKAATKVIEDLLNRYGENVYDYAPNIARAALTAAAQVREREGPLRGADGWQLVPTSLTPEMRAGATGWHGIDEMWRKTLAAAPVPDLAGDVESLARALHEAHKPYCDYTYPFDDPMSSSDMYRVLARAVTLVRGPALMPIYGATEDISPSEHASAIVTEEEARRIVIAARGVNRDELAQGSMCP